MLCNDIWIKSRAEAGMITPYVPHLVREADMGYGTHKVLSYGASSYGYDLRLSSVIFYVFRHVPGTVVDPKRFSMNNLERAMLHRDGNGESYFILPAHSYGLGVALERLKVPDNCTIIILGKSTYARTGVICNATPAEAGWEGHLTLEFSNASSADVRLYAGEGIAQALFFLGEPCATTYAARSGKYQNQPEQVVIARV